MDPDRKLRGLTRRPQMTRRGTDRPRHVRKEENFTDHQDGNLKVNREKLEPVQIKEEWDELTTPQMTDNKKKQEMLSITKHHQLIKEEQVELHILQDQEQLEHLQVTAEKVEREPKNQAEQQHQQTKEEHEELEILQVKVEETEIGIGLS
ncbi:involucrin-like [Fundulus heteroclitus]|uniref:involucrin-like n=1 Tax=Fundulus heteroclitus TaxID=8078 RepID=UPI00165B89BF|nr:involucrin-like [Fundulus heteroclitus]